MRQIPITSIAAWQSTNPAKPAKINTVCGVCERSISLSVESGEYRGENTWHADVRCSNPACRRVIRFIAFDLDASTRPTKLYMHSAQAEERKTICGLEAAPERVQRSYKDTIRVFNSKVPSAVATLARRTLEGIIENAYPNIEDTRERPLLQLIKELPEKRDLGAPIIGLSSAMREGGQLGAHFDLDKDTDNEDAERMIELLEHLIEYLYIIPHQVDSLKKHFE